MSDKIANKLPKVSEFENPETRNKLKQSFAKIGSYFFVLCVAIVLIVVIFFVVIIAEFIREFNFQDEALELISEFLKSKNKNTVPVVRLIESL